jgi:hypothetical protein
MLSNEGFAEIGRVDTQKKFRGVNDWLLPEFGRGRGRLYGSR